jgi:hypothetical protein
MLTTVKVINIPPNNIHKIINRKYIFPCIFLMILTFLTPSAFSQDNTLYLMPDVPQTNQLNPAYFKLCRVYIELPVISSIRLNLRNTGFGFHDVIEPGTGAQSNIYYIDLEKLDQHLKPVNYAQVETDVSLLGFGFGLNDWYLTFNISNHSDALIVYPKNLLELKDANLLNAGEKTVNFSRLGAETTVWNSIGISAAKEFQDGLKLGFRVKYLQGMANAITRNSTYSINQTVNPTALSSTLKTNVNSSFPVNVNYDPSGIVRSLDFSNSFDNFISNFIFNRNRGISIDGGVVYDPDDETEISAGFTDLGFIRWKKNVNRFNTNGNYFFNDSSLTAFQVHSGQADLFAAFRDSLFGSATNSVKPYYTLTPVKIFAGVTHVILPHLRAGAMTRIEFYDLRILPSVSLSLNYTPLPFLAASLSYTLMNNKFNQIGAGIVLGNKVVQFYISADNIPVRYTHDSTSAFFWPYNARMFSLHTGINLLFGCRDKENKLRPHGYKSRDDCPAYN